MEGLNLTQRYLIEFDFLITLSRWVEYVVVDDACRRANTIHTAYALHQTGSIPRRIVVDDDVRAMQVNTFCQHICCQDDVILVLLLFPVGVEVLADGLEQLTTILGGYHQYIWAIDTTLQVFYRINRF